MKSIFVLYNTQRGNQLVSSKSFAFLEPEQPILLIKLLWHVRV